MAKNLEQHHAFHDGLQAVDSYFGQVLKDPAIYEGGKVVAMLDEFGCIFVDHLNDEIGTLEPANMRKIFKDPKEAKEIDQKMVQWIVASSSLTADVPWVFSPSKDFLTKVMTHHDVNTCPWWPWRDIPYALIILGRYIFPWRYSRLFLRE
jgi:hypothetical protein